MNKIDDLFKYNQIISNEIERKIIIALFELLYNKQQITKDDIEKFKDDSKKFDLSIFVSL